MRLHRRETSNMRGLLTHGYYELNVEGMCLRGHDGIDVRRAMFAENAPTFHELFNLRCCLVEF